MSVTVASGTDRTEGLGEFGYVVVWQLDFHFTFKAYPIVSLHKDPATGLFTIPLMPRGEDGETTDPAEAAPSLSGFIKWDGCSEVSFEDDPHWCGAHSWAQHIRLMAWLLNKAASVHSNWWDDTIKLDVSVIRGPHS